MGRGIFGQRKHKEELHKGQGLWVPKFTQVERVVGDLLPVVGVG